MVEDWNQDFQILLIEHADESFWTGDNKLEYFTTKANFDGDNALVPFHVIKKKKYENNPNVILCDSLQSIEYWFLLHFEDTCRHFQDSAATERALKQYLPTYDKTRKYLEKDKWVKEIFIFHSYSMYLFFNDKNSF